LDTFALKSNIKVQQVIGTTRFAIAVKHSAEIKFLGIMFVPTGPLRRKIRLSTTLTNPKTH